MESWKRDFLQKQRKSTIESAIETGIIDNTQREYYDQLLRKDLELGQKLLSLQHKKWRDSFTTKTPEDLHNFLSGMKSKGGVSSGERQKTTKGTPTRQETSEYAFMLKNREKELRELKERAPEKFRELLEKHLAWREEGTTNYSV